MKQSYNNRIEKLESNINKGIRNTVERENRQVNGLVKKYKVCLKSFLSSKLIFNIVN